MASDKSDNRQVTDKKRPAPRSAFKAGKSGNPGGRPKRTQEEIDLVAACRSKAGAALEVIERIMISGENERNQLSAAQAIIERAYGKPVQPTDIRGADGGPIEFKSPAEFSDEMLAAVIAGAISVGGKAKK